MSDWDSRVWRQWWVSRRAFHEVWNSNKRAVCPGGLQNTLFPSQWVFTSVLCLEKHHEVTSLRLGHYIHYLLHPGLLLAAVFMIKFLYSLGLAHTEVMRPLHHSVCPGFFLLWCFLILGLSPSTPLFSIFHFLSPQPLHLWGFLCLTPGFSLSA